jgi:hypothetical protein
VHLDSEAEFPHLPQRRGSAASLAGQVVEEGPSSPRAAVLVGEIPVPLVRETAAPPSEEGVSVQLGFSALGPVGAAAGACWAGPTAAGPGGARSALQPRTSEGASDEGHVAQGHLCAVGWTLFSQAAGWTVLPS